ncbi:MAG: SPOR domain-containing protein, partial [Parvularculaceae bacterium]
ALGFESQGLARVRVRYLGRADLMARAPLYGSDDAKRLAAQEAPASRISLVGTTAVSATPAAPQNDAPDTMAQLVEEALASPGPAAVEYWIDVASFADLEALETARLNLSGEGEARVVSAPAAGATSRYGLQIGPFTDAAAAFARLAALREAGYPDALIAGTGLCLAEAPAEPETASC